MGNCKKCGKPLSKNGSRRGPDGERIQRYICFPCRDGKKPGTIARKVKGISTLELRQKHDLNLIITTGAEALVDDIFLTTSEFVLACKVKVGSGFRAVIDHPDFDKYHGKAGGIVYWSSPKSIMAMKEKGILS